MREPEVQGERGRWYIRAVAISAVFILSGCAINPHPVGKQELASVVQRDREAAQAECLR